MAAKEAPQNITRHFLGYVAHQAKKQVCLVWNLRTSNWRLFFVTVRRLASAGKWTKNSKKEENQNQS